MRFFGNEQPLDQPYLSLLSDVSFKPIFILGGHRSGTTLLHTLLAQTGQFNFVTAYHVIRRDEIIFNYMNGREEDSKAQLERLFKSLGLNNRLLDETPVGHGLPEEYSSILRGRARYRLSPKNLKRFVQFCKKVQFVSPNSRSLLLKNPWDFSSFVYIKSIFPDARFVFIHRHPISTINSLLKVLRSSLAGKNPYLALLFERYDKIFNRPLSLFIARLAFSPHFDLGVRLVTREVFLNTDYFLQNIKLMPVTDYISVTYEDLCEEPDIVMGRILESLRVGPMVPLNYREFIRPRPIDLLEEVQRRRESILKRFSNYLAFCKYD